MNMQRMSMKMDNMVTTIKSGNSNQIMMGSFNKIVNLLHYSKQPNIENMAANLQLFENTMDEMMINGKVMDEMMNKNSNTDSTADNMMEKLKMEMALEVPVFASRRLKHSSTMPPSFVPRNNRTRSFSTNLKASERTCRPDFVVLLYSVQSYA